MKDITIVPNDYIAIHTKTDTVMKTFNDGCVVYEVIEDRRPLVRCRDCKYWHEWENGTGSCHRSENGCNWFGVDATDYCSFGEREDGEE